MTIFGTKWGITIPYNIVRSIESESNIFVCDCLGMMFEERHLRLESSEEVAKYIVKIHNERQALLKILKSLAVSYTQTLEEITIIAQHGDYLPIDRDLTEISIEIGLLKEAHKIVNDASL